MLGQPLGLLLLYIFHCSIKSLVLSKLLIKKSFCIFFVVVLSDGCSKLLSAITKLKSWLLVHTLLNLMSILTTRRPLSLFFPLSVILASYSSSCTPWMIMDEFSLPPPSLNARLEDYLYLVNNSQKTGLTHGTQKEDFVKIS